MFDVLITAGIIIGVIGAVSVLLTLIHYPYAVDGDEEVDQAEAREYYKDAYEQADCASKEGRFEQDEEYVEKARAHARAAGIPQTLEAFARSCHLQSGRVLEVGCGSGLLQDVVRRYIGMDVSSRAHRFFHKPFVEASATAIPFPDGAFDGVWSIWVLEHVSNPERALTEIRRVVKNGGYILLRPAWNCDPWAAEGYEVRPYRDLSIKGKLVKASIPVRMSPWYLLLHSRQIRALRTAITALSGGPSRLHFKRLKPNYDKYWVTDSDAVVSLDFYEMYLWFTSRGDDCVNCPSRAALLWGLRGRRPQELLIRVNKTHRAAERLDGTLRTPQDTDRTEPAAIG